MEYETRGAFGLEEETPEKLEPEKVFVPEPEADESGEDSSDDESEPELDQGRQSGAHQEVPAAVRYDSFTGAPQPITSHEKRTRRCLAPGSDARGVRQLFSTGANHAPRSTGVHGMARLAVSAEKRNGRATRAPGMGGSSPSEREVGARHQSHLTNEKSERTGK